MSKILRLLLILAVVSIAIYGVNKLYFHFTDGFRPANIQSHIANDPRWDVHSLTPSQELELAHALNQRYYYLDKGHQAYVFESADKKYVLKFPKFHRNRIKPWLEHLPLPASWESYRQSRIAFKNERMYGVLESWKVAFDQLQEENGLLIVQINSTQNRYPELTIEDKMGFAYPIDLNAMTFQVQRKAQLICPAIDAAIKCNDLPAAKQYITAMVALFLSEYTRGFAETDKWVLRNTGFVGNKAIHIDAGRLVMDDKYKDPQMQRVGLLRKTAELREWLTGHHPELLPHLDEVVY